MSREDDPCHRERLQQSGFLERPQVDWLEPDLLGQPGGDPVRPVVAPGVKHGDLVAAVIGIGHVLVAPFVLNIFTTRAPGAMRATSSPADIMCPMVRWVSSGATGLVQSSSTLPARSPAASSARGTAPHGTAIRTVSPFTALLSGPISAFTFSASARFLPSLGSRTQNVNWGPALGHLCPTALSTLL